MTQDANEGLVVRDLRVAYQKNVVLDGVSLYVEPGETLVLFGLSGAGKTVLLRAIAGVETGATGQVCVAGRDVSALGPERRNVGVAFQNFALYPHMAARANIASPLLARKLPKVEVESPRVVRLRQDLDPAHDRGIRERVRGHDHAGRKADRPAAPGAARGGDGVRGLRALPAADGVAEHRLRPATRAGGAETGRGSGGHAGDRPDPGPAPRRPLGGQQQRASLARALARDADLHLLDEPMGQLEPQLRSVLRGRVKALCKERGFTAVLVTHDQTEANAMADRIAIMEAGVLQQFGTPDELRDRPANLFVGTFLGEPPMNVLPATVEQGGLRLKDDPALSLAVPGLKLPVGAEVMLGVRPHRLQVGPEASGGSWRAHVVSNHWLGDQAHVALEMAGRLLVAVSNERVAATVGAEIPILVESTDIHVFSTSGDGRALLHGGSPA